MDVLAKHKVCAEKQFGVKLHTAMIENWHDPDLTQPVPGREPASEKTRPRLTEPMARFQPVPLKKRRQRGLGCLALLLIPVVAFFAAYFLTPFQTRILLMGIDRAPEGSMVARTDTIILVGIEPLQPRVRLLSIPRDLWVTIPGEGENRINTAHFFAEAKVPGSGPRALQETLRYNFGLNVPFYARVRFEGFVALVDAMGGITLDLPEPMAGLDAGQHHLNGEQALAFVRNRTGSDDFFRMAHGQLLLKAAFRQMLKPSSWPRIPAVLLAATQVVDTNVPTWLWPRLALALLRAGPDGIETHVLGREMVTPFTTSGGANVLLPNWEVIRPMVQDMFGS
ncbi:MAG: LCP family protein [Thermanaerothrix sp.]|uniref:LCP family protein n=1 Tax=Thermanaerothrix solaris TaxID=3058434 RepID=A0ABU3NR71_9CHLR|nr:LCP family protein [Thermanaerothrix sp. 4228-RoL]MDT8898870.1 LCP family protein [Thermanaerothrix sp. 4228-RoL]